MNSKHALYNSIVKYSFYNVNCAVEPDGML